jgi:hypothetical protein
VVPCAEKQKPQKNLSQFVRGKIEENKKRRRGDLCLSIGSFLICIGVGVGE